ncbi:hypothetical protein [Bacillus rubiinfantis]|uniref:hypothetical protein n=1 Tax=Bacillus rubiinfantis TaxID=1499680 RepID=UPI0005AA4EAA|nr:hypothetical protein [Bacillus rubiinfantis]
MDKAIIVGIYNFIGLQLCHTLLHKGIEVNGIHIKINASQFIEDKKMEIGRNANFVEHSLEQLNFTADTKEEVIILDIYSLFIHREEDQLSEEVFTSQMVDLLQKNREAQLVIIEPIQMLMESIPPIEAFLEQIHEMVKSTQFIYLPTVFGPWQPAEFLFHQAILSSTQKIDLAPSEREWTEDAIYIEDAAETIFEVIELAKPGHYLLESGKEGYWTQCAALLAAGIEPTRVNWSPSSVGSNLCRINVKQLTPLKEAVAAQKHHVHQYYRHKN